MKDELKLNVRVIGISNSRSMHFDESGIALKDWKSVLKDGEKADQSQFFERVKSLNYRNSVFDLIL